MQITEAQLYVLDVLARMLREQRTAPTLEELAEQAGRGRSTVQGHLMILRREGYVDTVPGRHRSTHVTDKGRRALRRARG